MFLQAVKDGIFKALRTALMLFRIMIPISLGITLLRHTDFFMWLAEKIEPAMRIFGLPGEAVVPIVVGAFSDEYAVVAAMNGFPFDMAQITIIAMITLAFHALPIETVISRKIGMPAFRIGVFRLGLAIFTGIVVALLGAAFLGGNMPGQTPVGFDGIGVPAVQSTGIFDAGPEVILPQMGLGVVRMILIVLRVLIPLMVGIELMMVYNIIEAMAEKMGFFRRLLGIGKDALLPLLIGLLLGVTFGAGAIMELSRERPLPKRDLALVAVFIFACHGLIEGAYLLTLAGGNLFILIFVRLGIAVGVTAAAAHTVLRPKSGQKSYKNLQI